VGDCRLRGALSGVVLHNLHLHDVEAVGSDLANLDARGGALTRVLARLCRLTGAQVIDASLRDVTFADCRMEYAVFAGARLDRVVFRDCDLREVSLEDTQLRDVRFERCDLSGAALRRSRLLRVELEGCRLDGLNAISDLRGAALPWPDIVAQAGTFAAALGIGVVGDEDDA
jgi:uncharacterized protein YjbI with pentapeptide repeats